MLIAGLTGGIATGKSTVLDMFARQGARVFSADRDSRLVLAEDGTVRQRLREAFPDAWTAGGELDRARLGAIIFASPEARSRLESLMHPAIIARMVSNIAEARAQGPGLLVYETPLLYEANLEHLFDVTIAVLANPMLQRRRLQERQRAAGQDPLSEDEIAGRLSAQIPPEEKAHRAGFVVRTDTTLAETENQVRAVFDILNNRETNDPIAMQERTQQTPKQ